MPVKSYMDRCFASGERGQGSNSFSELRVPFSIPTMSLFAPDDCGTVSTVSVVSGTQITF